MASNRLWLPMENPGCFAADDVVFCDSVMQVTARKKIRYRVISSSSLEAVSELMA